MKEEIVSLVLPVYNQADHIEVVVRNYYQALQRVPIGKEFLLVPNGCRDSSADVCHRLAAELEGVRVLELQSGGWGKAVRVGIAAASGDIVAYTNVARTKPEDLTLMVLYAIAHRDVVIKANRKVRDSLFRRLGSLLYNIECRMLFDLPYWDINGTPKVFSRSCSKLFELQCENDLIDLEFAICCRKQNYPMLEVPTLSPYRIGGKSTTTVNSALYMYLGALKIFAANYCKEESGPGAGKGLSKGDSEKE